MLSSVRSSADPQYWGCAAGRAAPVTGEEIEAVARLLFSLHPMTMTERNGEYDDVSERARHHYQSEARWLLNEARLAVQLEEEQ